MKKPPHKTSGEASREASRKSSRTLGVKEPPAAETVSDAPGAAADVVVTRESLAEPENLDQGIAVSNFATKQDLWEVKTELKEDLFDMERRLDEKMEKRLDGKMEKMASKEALAAVQDKIAAVQNQITEFKRDIITNFRWTVGILVGVVVSAQIPLYIKLFFG